ncbi:methyl-accepting chemotaxis protein [Brevibacillus humidisoli]|uniref:methyl-accepting chemotaxis protein n=1 Tax=Brevibacillus humidisoli TaxID=2895522 RepID=UPI001E5D485A|nr:methyl-accepting chemotaxis protein [Brevibacillus humidisoli]UFJ41742.1 methyl-accepting chemotaxis protein [Brevibacillus humidisoli]
MKTRHLGLNKKIGILSLIILFGFASVISLVIYMVHRVSLADGQIANHHLLILHAREIQKSMLEARMDEVRLLWEKDLAYKKEAEQKMVTISLTLDKIIKSTENQEILTHIQNVKDLSFEYTLTLNEVADQLEQQKQLSSAEANVVEDFNRISGSIQHEITEIMYMVEQLVQQGMAEKENMLNEISLTIISVSLGISVLSMVTMVIMIRQSILNPVNKLGSAVHHMAMGDFTYRVSRKKKRFKDEIDDMLDQFERMQHHLADMLGNILAFSKEVAHFSEHLLLNAGQVSRSAEEIASSCLEMSASMGQQATRIEKNVVNVEQLSKRMDDMESGTSAVSLASRTAVQAVNQGESKIRDLIDQMKKIEQTIWEMVQRVELFHQSSQEIEGIVQIMSEMSDQTQLLALNAAIESARVGDAGKGFAVVAEEIGKLAAGSKQSSARIRELIGQIRQNSVQIYQQMNVSKDEVISGVDQAEQTERTFRMITESFAVVFRQIQVMEEAVKNIHVFSQDVYQSSEQMWKELQGINEGLENISAGSEEQTASTQEMTASLEKLTMEAKRLYESVQRFKLQK